MPKPEPKMPPVYICIIGVSNMDGPFDATTFPVVTNGGVVIHANKLMVVTGQANFVLVGDPACASADVIFLDDVPDIVNRLFSRIHVASNETVDAHTMEEFKSRFIAKHPTVSDCSEFVDDHVDADKAICECSECVDGHA
jgi:hypothetical protein